MYTNVRRLALLAMLDLAQRSTPREKKMFARIRMEGAACHPDDAPDDISDEQYKAQLLSYSAETGDQHAFDGCVRQHIADQCKEEARRNAFEDAMVELVNAKDGNGLPVHLYRGNWSAADIRDATRAFLLHVAHPEDSSMPIFVNGLDPKPSSTAEAAYWENLAKLAKATAAAIRAGR